MIFSQRRGLIHFVRQSKAFRKILPPQSSLEKKPPVRPLCKASFLINFFDPRECFQEKLIYT